jgi:hypothetical protein
MKPNIKKAKKHLKHLRELVAKRQHPFEGMTEEQIIEQLRKTREKLWEKKIASRT